MLPWIAYLELLIAGGDDLGDRLDILIKAFEGKTRNAKGVLGTGATGDVATITASGGKDMYLVVAEGSLSNLDVGSLNIINLVINGAIVETLEFTLSSTSQTAVTYKFNFSGKVATGQIIKITRTTASGATSIRANIEVFEENTGVSPQIPPLQPV